MDPWRSDISARKGTGVSARKCVLMKASSRFIYRTVAGEHLLIPTGEAAQKIRGLIALSESGAVLYALLRDGCTRQALVNALTQEYEVDAQEAARDVDAFLEQMRQMQLLEEENEAEVERV